MDQAQSQGESHHSDVTSGGTAPWDVVVVGAGAAGLLAALTAARGGARTLLLESTKDGGRKILISGGGRCNILPSEAAPERYVTNSSVHTLRKILRSWPLAEQIAFFERELGQPLVREPETGKLFPESNRARDVRDGLLARVREASATLWFGTRAVGLEPPREPSQPEWQVKLGDGQVVQSRTVIVATGGLSVPATGSDGWGLAAARELGLVVEPTYPALTPLVLQPTIHAHLAGVSLPVTIRASRARPRFETRGGFLFTHRGYSGPSVLDVSHVAVRAREGGTEEDIRVQWTEESSDVWDERLRDGAGSVGGALDRALPRRLAEQLLAEADVDGATQRAQLDRASRKRLVESMCSYQLRSTGDEGYKKAEVTGGGVALAEVDTRTLQARKNVGLFLCGEVLDAFGPIGGHNFMWAWATGRAPAHGAIELLAAHRAPI